jgi:hypothetical protein
MRLGRVNFRGIFVYIGVGGKSGREEIAEEIQWFSDFKIIYS